MHTNYVNLDRYHKLYPTVRSIAYIIVFLFSVFFSSQSIASFHVIDSTGLETIGGKTYIIHKVSAKETLYSLSRRYSVSVADIRAANAGLDNNLDLNQVIKVPYKPKIAKPKGSIYHTVGAQETLYAISRKYHVSIESIKKWNKLSGNDLNLGQRLIVFPDDIPPVNNGSTNQANNRLVKEAGDVVHTVTASETLYGISRKYGVNVADIKKWNQLKDNEIDLGQKIIVKQPATNTASASNSKKSIQEKASKTKKKKDTKPVKKDKKGSEFKSYDKSMDEIKRVNTRTSGEKGESSGFNKKIEIGFAEVIKVETSSKKWLALHRTAPIGTIVRVKNEMNNLWVFVRVVGVLPETSINDKVLIKISETAYDKLGAINARFPVEISYVP